MENICYCCAKKVKCVVMVKKRIKYPICFECFKIYWNCKKTLEQIMMSNQVRT